MAESTDETSAGPREAEELGSGGDQDVVKGPPAGDDVEFIRIGTASDPFEADLLATVLGEAGMPVLARAMRDAVLDSIVVPGPATWALFVPEAHAVRGRELLTAGREELHASAKEAGLAAEAEAQGGEGEPD